MRGFRFNLQASGVTDPTALVDLARQAEDLGYASLSIADHLDGQLAPFPMLTAVAGATTTLRLTTLVLCNDYRHPAWVAQEAATLDLISDGRLELGIGAGWMRSDYDSTGLPYDRPSVRIARLAEGVTIIKGLLSGTSGDFAGSHYRIEGLTTIPAPRQQPHPPILIAGGAEKILTLAGREADIVGINPNLAAGVIDARAGATATPAATDAKLAWIRAGAGDRFDQIELQTRVHLAVVTDDRDTLAAAMAGGLGLSVEEALGSPHALVGTVEQCIETLHQWRERWGITNIGLPADALTAFAPVVAALAGS